MLSNNPNMTSSNVAQWAPSETALSNTLMVFTLFQFTLINLYNMYSDAGGR